MSSNHLTEAAGYRNGTGMGPWYMPINGETETPLPLPLGLAENVETGTVKHPTKGVGYCLFRVYSYAVHSQDDCQGLVVFENTLLSSLLFY